MKKRNMSENKKLYTFLVLLPYMIGILFYQKLPSEMAVHYNIYLEPDIFVAKAFALFVIPTFFLVLSIFSWNMLEQEKENYGKNLVIFLKYLMPTMSNVVILILIGTALGYIENIGAATGVMIGVILTLSGNYITKSKINKYVGYRTPTTLKSEKIWYKVNRLTGIIMISYGLILVVTSIFSYIWLCYTIVLFLITIIFVPLIYIKKLKKNL